MSLEVARKTLTHWGLEGAELSLVAERENLVFRVRRNEQLFAFRLHRPGYQTEQMILSELAWMQHLRHQGLPVPEPLLSQNAHLLEKAGLYHADLLTWLSGKPMGETGEPLKLADRTGTFFSVGALMAKVHAGSDAWSLPDTFERQSWDLNGLLGDEPLWGRFWDNPELSHAQRHDMVTARDRLREDLREGDLDFGLIHADMLRENLLIDGDQVRLIDFDDSGFGYRLFDVATALFKNRFEPDYAALEQAFLQGYRSVRHIDTKLLPQFMLIRALSYLGWIIERMDEPRASERQTRFLSSALPLLDAYLRS